jgi:hypothetical protein
MRSCADADQGSSLKWHGPSDVGPHRLTMSLAKRYDPQIAWKWLLRAS